MRSLHIPFFGVLALTVFTLTACQSTHGISSWELRLAQQVEPGMSAEEVEAVMGEPERVDSRDGTIKWMVYGGGDQHFLVYFEEGKVKNFPSRRESDHLMSSWAF